MLAVERAFNRQPAALEDVGVGHGGYYILMPEQLLDCADIVAVLKQMSGEGMAKSMR